MTPSSAEKTWICSGIKKQEQSSHRYTAIGLKAENPRRSYLRLSNKALETPFAKGFEYIFANRKEEADAFYADILPSNASPAILNLQRQALAGLLWSKQYYHYDVEKWLSTGDGISSATAGKQYRPKSRLEASQKPGYHRHARQMGISLVCGLGYGFPMYSHVAGGRLFRQEPAAADHAGVVYETRWAITRL